MERNDKENMALPKAARELFFLKKKIKLSDIVNFQQTYGPSKFSDQRSVEFAAVTLIRQR